MPRYSYRCSCGALYSEFRSIANRHDGPVCECGENTRLVIEAPQIQAQILGGGTTPGYLCPVTGEYVTSRNRRRDIMKEYDLIEASEPSDRKEKMLEATNGTGVSN